MHRRQRGRRWRPTTRRRCRPGRWRRSRCCRRRRGRRRPARRRRRRRWWGGMRRRPGGGGAVATRGSSRRAAGSRAARTGPGPGRRGSRRRRWRAAARRGRRRRRRRTTGSTCRRRGSRWGSRPTRSGSSCTKTCFCISPVRPSPGPPWAVTTTRRRTAKRSSSGRPGGRVDRRALAAAGQRRGDLARSRVASRPDRRLAQPGPARGDPPRVGGRVQRRLEARRPLDPVVVGRRPGRRRPCPSPRPCPWPAARRTTRAVDHRLGRDAPVAHRLQHLVGVDAAVAEGGVPARRGRVADRVEQRDAGRACRSCWPGRRRWAWRSRCRRRWPARAA